ncbi:hypothetical protein DT019_03015 [Streptomyces sp. SDr-06]|uniref:hypothetical protein n=1 Tax=Streptomyces sp. SDr-06 TaxID=2267702 RepID=UPI000DEB36A6|nr:hypothetical protein [Streptomyces sp. SDr-06]RCH70474.1 hypothetical protein DT019_03015 [Streptomyces sp. SDr-06]
MPDIDDLWIDDRVDVTNPPEHCGMPMKVWAEAGGYRLVCLDDDLELSTDANGIITEPPLVRE